ncbi:MAG TPA: heme lyase CcmF/NrfE family subunit [Chloroflexota bacterium]|nr:heme lyase CcmF/NrfE family subunit [Chloroflexota bacterium]
MTSAIGHFTILTALCVGLTGAGASFYGGWHNRSDLVAAGRAAVFLVFGLLTFACAVMIYALVTHDFSVKYVADVGSRETPLYYTVISLWAALEGSILFWGFILAGYATLVIALHRFRYREIMPYIAGVLLLILAFFLFVMSGPGNPFVYVPHPLPDGPGPNPLLQNHPMMGLHPPLLYLGYVGLSVPFAIVMGALIAGDARQSWLQLARRWALVSWCFLTLGIIAGMWWSYDVLGWGGYWSWDPVENAVLMPWLVTTAFLHSLQVQERRLMLKTWTLSLVVAAFLLSIMGTFLARSGVLESVHSFTQSAIGPVFLVFLGICLVCSMALLLMRSQQLEAPGSIDSLVSRESAFLLNNLLLVSLTFTILLGTLFPLLAEATTGQRLSVGAPYFNRIAVPIALGLLFLMGVGPLLPWGATRLDETVRRLVIPALAGLLTVIVLLSLGIRGTPLLLVFALVAFVAASTVGAVVHDVNSRRRNTAEDFLPAAAHLFRANPRRYAGYLAHIGVLFAVVGIAASQSFSSTASATLNVGQRMHLSGYTLDLAAIRSDPQPNRTVVDSILNVSTGGRTVGSMSPSINYYPNSDQPVITPAVHIAATQDLYVVVRAIDRRLHWVSVQVYVKPLVSWIWFGGTIVGLGAIMALMPRRRRQTAEERVAQVALPEPVEVPG